MTLTPAGQKVMAKGSALLMDAFGKRLGKLNAAQQSQLGELLCAMDRETNGTG